MIDWCFKTDFNRSRIGLAIRYHDHILGPIWIWGGSLDRYRCLPSAYAFKYQSFDESIYGGHIAKHLARLQSAGLITIQDRVMILKDFNFEVDIWRGVLKRNDIA
jgi:hypothetical protein